MQETDSTQLLVLFKKCFVTPLICVLFLAAPASGGSEVSNLLRSAYDKYILVQFDNGIQIGNELLQRRDLAPRDSIAVYEFLAVCTYAKGTRYRDSASDYLNKIADVGPCLNRLPQEFWPEQLCDQWYRIKQARNVFACPTLTSSEIRTIAFFPFDNNSVGDYRESLGGLGHTIAEFLVYHFTLFEKLDVIERTKLEYLLREQGITRDGAVDETTAIQVGKLLGCHLMVLGSIFQSDKKHARLMARVVHVETGKVLTAVIKEGKPEFDKLEKELVEELARELKISISEEARKALEKSGTNSIDALKLYNRGLAAIDSYDYGIAYEYFQEALAVDPAFAEAEQKLKNCKPLVGQI